MHFSILGSGSSGNCVLVAAGGTTLLVEAGLSLKETRARACQVGIQLGGLAAILVTHEHADHVLHASRLSLALNAPVIMNAATRRAASRFLDGDEAWVGFESGSTFRVGAIEVEAVRKPHDAAEPVAFVLRHGGAALGIFTDLGHADDAVLGALSRCNALFIEANHDPVLLERGPYPPSLKHRVGGRLGHLCNDDSARAVAAAAPSLGVLVLGHISAKNNTTAHVRRSFIRQTGRSPGYGRWLSVQHRPTPLLSVRGEVIRPVATT